MLSLLAPIMGELLLLLMVSPGKHLQTDSMVYDEFKLSRLWTVLQMQSNKLFTFLCVLSTYVCMYFNFYPFVCVS